MPYPIQLYWVDVEGRKVQFTRSLKSSYPADTYYTHPWIFKKSSDGTRLIAYASGINNSVFEGGTFDVKKGSTVHIIISDKGFQFEQ